MTQKLAGSTEISAVSEGRDFVAIDHPKERLFSNLQVAGHLCQRQDFAWVGGWLCLVGHHLSPFRACIASFTVTTCRSMSGGVRFCPVTGNVVLVRGRCQGEERVKFR